MSQNSSTPNHAHDSNSGATGEFASSSDRQDGSTVEKDKHDVLRVSVPNVELDSSPWNNAEELEAATDERLRLLSRAVASAGSGATMDNRFQRDGQFEASQSTIDAAQTLHAETEQPTEHGLGKILSANVPEDVRPFWEEYEEERIGNRLAGVVDSILEEFPIQQPRTILFVGVESEKALDEITAEVAQLLARRRVGKVLLVDANVGTAALSAAAGAADSAGLVEAIEGAEPWQSHLQTGAPSGLEFLPLGRSQIGHVDKAAVGSVLKSMQPYYQFTCLSVGNFDAGLAPMLLNECDGSFLLIDMSKANKTQAKYAVEQLNLATSKMVGCIALGE